MGGSITRADRDLSGSGRRWRRRCDTRGQGFDGRWGSWRRFGGRSIRIERRDSGVANAAGRDSPRRARVRFPDRAALDVRGLVAGRVVMAQRGRWIDFFCVHGARAISMALAGGKVGHFSFVAVPVRGLAGGAGLRVCLYRWDRGPRTFVL